jgi:hypothetical protein
MNRNKKFSFWPTVGDEQAAVLAARRGFHAAVYCSIVTAVFAVLGGFGFQIMDFNLWNLTDAGLIALLAFGIRRMSRTAALIALLVLCCRTNRSVDRVRSPESSHRRNLRFDVPVGCTWHLRLSPFEAAT